MKKASNRLSGKGKRMCKDPEARRNCKTASEALGEGESCLSSGARGQIMPSLVSEAREFRLYPKNNGSLLGPSSLGVDPLLYVPVHPVLLCGSIYRN